MKCQRCGREIDIDHYSSEYEHICITCSIDLDGEEYEYTKKGGKYCKR